MIKNRHLLSFSVLSCVFLTVGILLVGPLQLGAGPFGKTTIIIETNATAGDVGLQIFVDTEGWTLLEVFDPNGAKIFEGTAKQSLQTQGVSEFFFESSEPPLNEVSLADFFLRFPAGTYTFKGIAGDGKPLSGKAVLNHVIPNGPVVESPEEGEVLNAGSPVVIDWDPVTGLFPGSAPGLDIVAYQVIVEQAKPQSVRIFSITVPAATTQVTLPPELIQPGAEYKFEVLAIDAGGNQTITEGSFKAQ